MRTSIDPSEVHKFEGMASDWWNNTGSHKVLHDLLPLRISYLTRMCDQLLHQPLKGMKILDVGCGGGVLCEALTRLGATVTGVDVSAKSIDIAQTHALESNVKIDYHCSEVSAIQDTFDLVVAFEVIEHVTQVTEFVQDLEARVRPGGIVVLSTINRTSLSYLTAIVGAEKIMQLLPLGTHTWDKFVKPSEIANAGASQVADIQGYTYNPLTGRGYLVPTLCVNYFMSLTSR